LAWAGGVLTAVGGGNGGDAGTGAGIPACAEFGMPIRRAVDSFSRLLAGGRAFTGLLNRRAFLESVGEACERAQKGSAASAIICDLDCFKQINDTHGHGVRGYGSSVRRSRGCAIRWDYWSAGRRGRGRRFRCVGNRRIVSPHRRASAFGTFTAGYGLFWFAGSVAIGILYDLWLPAAIAFCMLTQIAAVPIFVWVGHRVRRRLQ
jgi:hypothetical protein